MNIFIRFLLLTLEYILFFSLARIVFFMVFVPAKESFNLILKTFLIGTRLDLSLICILFALPAILLPFISKSSKKIILFLFKFYFYLLNSIIIFLTAVEFAFFAEYGSKLNHLFFEYFDRPKELIVTLWGMYPIIRYTPVMLLIIIFIIYLTKKSLNLLIPKIKLNPIKQIFLFLLIAIMLFIGIRGGLQRRPINWGIAYFSQSNFLNQTALNGIYNLIQSIKYNFEEKKSKIAMSKFYKNSEAIDYYKKFSHYNLNKKNNLISIKKGVKPNVILIFMESFLRDNVGVFGGKSNITPRFDELSKQGLLFTQFYAGGNRTSRSLLAGLCSVPPLPGVNFTKKIEAQQKIPSIGNYLKKIGYNSYFFYGGDRGFENMGGFYTYNGFDKFYDCKDYTKIKYHNPIGVFDEELFENVNRILNKKNQPFFSAIMTLTNHGPWTVPEYYKKKYPNLSKAQRAFKYSDYSLGKFFDLAKKSNYYKNTIFIINSDHGRNYTNWNKKIFHIPMLIISDFIKRPKKINTICSQLDLPMTVLKLCSMDIKNEQTTFFGTSIFDKEKNGYAYFLDDKYFGFLNDKYLYRENFNKHNYLFNIKNNKLISIGKNPYYKYFPRSIFQLTNYLIYNKKLNTLWKK